MALVLPAATALATAAAPAISKAAGGLLSNLQVAIKNGTRVSSLADLARPARVEPLMIVEKSIAQQPYMEDIAKFSLTNFIGYYVQAINLLMNVGRIDTLKVFDSLNPYRSQGSVKDAVWSMEHYQQGLPSLEAFTQPAERGLVASLEDAQPDSNADIRAEMPKQVFEVDNLAVGKMITVELRDGDQSNKLPILVRLVPAAMPTQSMTHIFTAGGRDTWVDRYHLVRGGQIRAVRDGILGIDLIDDHRRALANDTSGVAQQIIDRRRNNLKKTLVTGAVSMADASNIAVMSKETAVAMGRAMYGKIDSKAVRDKIFDNSYLLMLIVVDERWERVTIYHRGQDMGSDYSFKEIKGAEKNKGPDITEVFKSFHQVLGQGV